MCLGGGLREQDQRGGGNQECPTSGPSGLAVLSPSIPTPAPLNAPAVHNDGAGAAPVALVHLPAIRNGREVRGHQQRERGTETHT